MVTGSDQLDALGLLTIPTGSATAGAVMAGYDGHRGWIYSIAVHPDHRKKNIGSDLLSFVQDKLSLLGCIKINLQILEENQTVQRFYLANGYIVEKIVSMGKKL